MKRIKDHKLNYLNIQDDKKLVSQERYQFIFTHLYVVKILVN